MDRSQVVAAGGWTSGLPERESIYLFEARTGRMTARIAGLPNVTQSLAYSSDGGYPVSTDGAIVDFGYKQGGKSLRSARAQA